MKDSAAQTLKAVYGGIDPNRKEYSFEVYF